MSTATISDFCALGSGVLRNVQCVGPSPWYGCVSSLLVYRSTSYCRAYHERELVYRRGVSQCTFSIAKAKRCPIVFVVCLKSLIANVTADILICVVVYARFFATHERLVLLL